jgi:hypothetical protein
VFRVECDGLVVGREGLVQLLLITQGAADRGIGAGVLRGEFEVLSICSERLRRLPLGPQRVPEVAIGVRVFRVECDGLLIGRDGLGELLLIP